MIISMIAAMAKNNVIGIKNGLPWDLPADMKHFRETTSGKTVIMGARTFESIGRALPKRRNIVVTLDKNQIAEGAEIAFSLDEAIESCKNEEEVMIIGGASIYRQFLPKAQRVYLTVIDGEFEGDAFFPEMNMNKWKIVNEEKHEADEKNSHPYTFKVFERV